MLSATNADHNGPWAARDARRCPIACLPASMMSSLEQARGGQSIRQGQHHPVGLQHAVGQRQASKR